MSKLNLGLHILVIYVVFIAHQIHGGGLHPTNRKAWYAHASPSKNSNDIVYFATHRTHPSSYYGLAATMDVYGHNISAGHIITSIWIANMEGDPKTDENAIWVGWQFLPRLTQKNMGTHILTSSRVGRETHIIQGAMTWTALVSNLLRGQKSLQVAQYNQSLMFMVYVKRLQLKCLGKNPREIGEYTTASTRPQHQWAITQQNCLTSYGRRRPKFQLVALLGGVRLSHPLQWVVDSCRLIKLH
uniref:Neprosin PEP catalytic domain-containing protein n=1 Tax=Triticum urartu TaxID=4572 RepID=A0A8R7UPS9_TRIUA